jgi:hypothetical protein
MRSYHSYLLRRDFSFWHNCDGTWGLWQGGFVTCKSEWNQRLPVALDELRPFPAPISGRIDGEPERCNRLLTKLEKCVDLLSDRKGFHQHGGPRAWSQYDYSRVLDQSDVSTQ